MLARAILVLVLAAVACAQVTLLPPGTEDDTTIDDTTVTTTLPSTSTSTSTATEAFTVGVAATGALIQTTDASLEATAEQEATTEGTSSQAARHATKGACHQRGTPRLHKQARCLAHPAAPLSASHVVSLCRGRPRGQRHLPLAGVHLQVCPGPRRHLALPRDSPIALLLEPEGAYTDTARGRSPSRSVALLQRAGAKGTQS